MLMMMTAAMKRNVAAAALVALATMRTSTTHVHALESVTISYQPALYWALPIYIAEERGYFADMDLNVSYVTYPSGAPQIADAVENAAWDVGGTGTVPCILGGLSDPLIETIGITNDESAANVLAGNANGVVAWPALNLTDEVIAATGNSTAFYAAEACLVKEGLDPTQANFLYGSQTDVLAAMQPNDTAEDSAAAAAAANFGTLWAPNYYTLLETVEDSEVLCSGKAAGVTVPGGMIVRKAYGDENGPTVAKVLAAWLRAIGYMQNTDNREATLDYMTAFYALNDVVISRNAMETEMDTRPIFNLAEQLELLTRSDGAASTVDTWFTDAASFLVNNSVITQAPAAESYISGTYMQLVQDDEELRAFTMMDDGSDGGETTPSPVENGGDETSAPAPTPDNTPSPSSTSAAAASLVVARVGMALLPWMGLIAVVL